MRLVIWIMDKPSLWSTFRSTICESRCAQNSMWSFADFSISLFSFANNDSNVITIVTSKSAKVCLDLLPLSHFESY